MSDPYTEEREYALKEAELAKISRNIHETEDLLGDLKMLNGPVGESTTVFVGQRNNKTPRHSDTRTMDGLMRDFLAANELSASSYDVLTCYERWEDYLLTKVPEIPQSKMTQAETRRIITAVNDLQYSNHKLALVVTDAHPRMHGRLEPPKAVSYAEVQRGLSLASVITEEEQVVKNVSIDLNEILEDTERELSRRERSSERGDSRSADRVRDLTRRLEDAEMRRSNDEMLIRELEDRLEAQTAHDPTPAHTLRTLATTVDDLRATVATMTPRNPAQQFLLSVSPTTPNLDHELSRLVELSKYLAVLGPLVPLDEAQQPTQTLPLHSHDHDEQIARLEREIDLLRERDEQRGATNNDEILSELVHEKNSVINKLEDDLRTLERTHRELADKYVVDQEHYDELLEEVASLKKRNKQLHQEIRDLRDKRADSVDTSLNNEIAALQGDNEGLQAHIDRLQEDLNEQTAREEQLLTEVSDLRSQLDAKHDTTGVEDLYEEIYALKTELGKKTDELTILEREGGAGRDRELADEVGRLQGEVDQLNEELRERDETEFLRGGGDSERVAELREEVARLEEELLRQQQQTRLSGGSQPPPPTANKFVQTDPMQVERAGRETAREDSEYMASCLGSDAEESEAIAVLQDRIRDLENRLNESNVLLQDYQDRVEEDAQRPMDDVEYENEELKEKVAKLEELLDQRDEQLQDAYREMHTQETEVTRAAERSAGSEHTQQLEEALSRLDTNDEGLMRDLHDLVANLKERDAGRYEEMQEQMQLQKQNYMLQQQLKDKQHQEEIAALKKRAANRSTGSTAKAATTSASTATAPAQEPRERKRVATVAKRRPKKQKYPFLGLELGALRSEIGGHGGLRVVDVRGPALAAGLQQDDIITEVEGVQITEQNDIKKAILKHSPQDAVYMKLIRDGTLYEVDVQPEESDIAPGQGAKYTARVLVKQRPSTYTSPRPQRESQTPPYPPLAPTHTQPRRPSGKELIAQAQAIFRKIEGVPEPPGSVQELRSQK